MVKKIDSVSKLKKDLKLTTSKLKLKETGLRNSVKSKPVQDSPIRRPIPKPKLLGTFKSDCYARARVPGEGFTIKKPVKVILDIKAEKNLQDVLKKENLSPARQ